MIKERVYNDMTLILHVVPLNQDTDTISSWRVVCDADNEQTRTISILTKADLALKDGKDVLKKRLFLQITSFQTILSCMAQHRIQRKKETNSLQ